MELQDIVGPGYPCKNCGLIKANHAGGRCYFNNLLNPIYTYYEPERIGLVLNLEAFKDTPLQDLASRLKAL